MSIEVTDNGWLLKTASTCYALGVNRAGRLAHRYWGPILPYSDDYPDAPQGHGANSFNSPAHVTPEEYPTYEDMKYTDPCLKANFHDGVRNVVLRFVESVVVNGPNPTLTVNLRDIHYPLTVSLSYRVHERYDLIERDVTLHNEGVDPITVERMLSASWNMPEGVDYRLTHLSGKWLDEMRVNRSAILPGLTVLESRRITSSHHHAPWFAVDRGVADEVQGEVWFGALEWSGNWKIVAEATDFNSTRIGVGLNDWDFAWRLNPGETFRTPTAYGGYTAGGFGTASHILHDFIRDTVTPHPNAPRKVLYNSWEATGFDVDEPGQIRLATKAASLGTELFVVDDGWFQGRSDDHSSLGDWWTDPVKFPSGLTPLIDHVTSLGMEFGIWIEPEMTNVDSDLYRAHPDWVLHYPNRPRTEGRYQLILNMGRTDVQDYLIDILDTLLRENDISFVKWDMNRNVSETGWPDAPGDQREIWVRYVQGVYRLWGTLRERHPDVVWQSCSGGGGRVDIGIFRFADQAWVSDNTEATARLRIHEGYTSAYPASTMESWVTDADRKAVPLEFRMHVSMCGVLGIGGNIVHWTDEECEVAGRWIASYKAIRHVIHHGDLHRLRSVYGGYSAVQYTAKDGSEAVLFAFRTHIAGDFNFPVLRLRGLIPDARYAIDGIDHVRSGAAWMQDGVHVYLGNMQSAVKRIRRAT